MPRKKSTDKILPSELRVLERMSNNRRCNESAGDLFISDKTAYTELANARKRNNLSNNVALCKFAIEEGYIPVSIKKKYRGMRVTIRITGFTFLFKNQDAGK